MPNRVEKVHTTPKSDKTYNSSNIKCFAWRERPDSDKYDRGQLIVWFRKGSVSRDDPPQKHESAYAYNLPRSAYIDMKRRAEEVTQNDEAETVGEWFSNTLPKKYFEPLERTFGSLYEDKI